MVGFQTTILKRKIIILQHAIFKESYEGIVPTGQDTEHLFRVWYVRRFPARVDKARR
jgi:hypothetical protein